MQMPRSVLRSGLSGNQSMNSDRNDRKVRLNIQSILRYKEQEVVIANIIYFIL